MASKGAGYYHDRLQILTQSTTRNSQGQAVESWTSGAYVWAYIDRTNGGRNRQWESTQTGTEATIYLRTTGGISATDHLQDSDGTVWHIEHMYRGDQEMILSVSMFDSGIRDS